ncbi:MAG: hypothetical protein A2X42_11870 [Candidatus Margulisbacteria bacterium GWF2_38_17]|nr:MAG: hypothetical protein A2X43_12535 [Candidatus Margulisbacteria bacterium GWD2_39_127]OGI01926.1 MAG: hypothetical protein A2X42_11870 [Candidatus Margulisbacteria bacterium GWF2_38_17]OGI11574.1 MAG: hypothetical protein A2X41_10095 [Candidatus Margulisbacteria bacterium GWE2_39_32]
MEEFSEKDFNAVMDKICEIGEEFNTTSYFESLTEEQKGHSVSIVKLFANHMYTYCLQTIEKWNVTGLVEVCIEIFPRKVTAPHEFFESVGPVLKEFFLFCAEKDYTPYAAKLSEAVERISNEIVENASSPENWGMAKSMMMPSPQQDSETGKQGRTIPFRSEPKTGRNEPCPCGSGKKYKKCCL